MRKTACFEGKKMEPEDRKSAKNVVAWVGKHDLLVEDEEGSQAHEVGELIIHEDWKHDEDNFDADIALLLLKTQVDLTQRQFVRIVCLPVASQGEVTGNGTIVSFGHSTDDNSALNELTFTAAPGSMLRS
jgi:hypothetical protein